MGEADVATELLHSLLLDDPAAWWRKLDEILARLEASGLCASCAVYVRHRRRTALYRCMAASPGAASLRSAPLGPDDALIKRMLSTPEGWHPAGSEQNWWTKRYPTGLGDGETPQFFAVAMLTPAVPRAGDSTLSDIFTSVFAALRATLTAAENAWMRESRGTIASVIHHDLRGPMNAVQSFAYALEDLSDDYARYRERLLDAVHRIHQVHRTLVERLYLPLATEPEGRETRWLYRPKVEPWLHVRRIVEAYRSSEIVDVSVPDDGACPEYVLQVDLERLELALRHVVNNALTHGRSSKRIHVELSVLPADPQLTISVRDHGIGISVAERSVVFDEGYRTTATRREMKGQGVGLTVAQAIIEDHGGRIWVDPDLPAAAGTRIVIQLPLVTRS